MSRAAAFRFGCMSDARNWILADKSISQQSTTSQELFLCTKVDTHRQIVPFGARWSNRPTRTFVRANV